MAPNAPIPLPIPVALRYERSETPAPPVRTENQRCWDELASKTTGIEEAPERLAILRIACKAGADMIGAAKRALNENNASGLQSVLDAGLDPLSVDYRGHPPLMWCIPPMDGKCFDTLIAAGADIFVGPLWNPRDPSDLHNGFQAAFQTPIARGDLNDPSVGLSRGVQVCLGAPHLEKASQEDLDFALRKLLRAALPMSFTHHTHYGKREGIEPISRSRREALAGSLILLECGANPKARYAERAKDMIIEREVSTVARALVVYAQVSKDESFRQGVLDIGSRLSWVVPDRASPQKAFAPHWKVLTCDGSLHEQAARALALEKLLGVSLAGSELNWPELGEWGKSTALPLHGNAKSVALAGALKADPEAVFTGAECAQFLSVCARKLRDALIFPIAEKRSDHIQKFSAGFTEQMYWLYQLCQNRDAGLAAQLNELANNFGSLDLEQEKPLAAFADKIDFLSSCLDASGVREKPAPAGRRKPLKL